MSLQRHGVGWGGGGGTGSSDCISTGDCECSYIYGGTPAGASLSFSADALCPSPSHTSPSHTERHPMTRIAQETSPPLHERTSAVPFSVSCPVPPSPSTLPSPPPPRRRPPPAPCQRLTVHADCGAVFLVTVVPAVIFAVTAPLGQNASRRGVARNHVQDSAEVGGHRALRLRCSYIVGGGGGALVRGDWGNSICARGYAVYVTQLGGAEEDPGLPDDG